MKFVALVVPFTSRTVPRIGEAHPPGVSVPIPTLPQVRMIILFLESVVALVRKMRGCSLRLQRKSHDVRVFHLSDQLLVVVRGVQVGLR